MGTAATAHELRFNMETRFTEILDQARKLNREEQVMLANALYEGLPADHKVHDAWLEESQRRAEAADRGEMTSRDADEVLADIRKMLGK
jgi:hypothetical protein